MKPFILFFCLLFAFRSLGQIRVEPRLSYPRPAIIEYFDSLLGLSQCSTCKILRDTDENGHLVLLLDLPKNQKKIMASFVEAVFVFSKGGNTPICAHVKILASKDYLPNYTDWLRSCCTKTKGGIWKYNTGTGSPGRRLFYRYRLDSEKKSDPEFILDALAVFQ